MTKEAATPRTAAGRAFYHGNAVKGFEAKLLRDILAIEAEAGRVTVERIRAAVAAKNGTYDWDANEAILFAILDAEGA